MPRCMLLPTNLYAFAHQWHGYNSESDAVCRIQVVFLGKKGGFGVSEYAI